VHRSRKDGPEKGGPIKKRRSCRLWTGRGSLSNGEKGGGARPRRRVVDVKNHRGEARRKNKLATRRWIKETRNKRRQKVYRSGETSGKEEKGEKGTAHSCRSRPKLQLAVGIVGSRTFATKDINIRKYKWHDSTRRQNATGPTIRKKRITPTKTAAPNGRRWRERANR